ncbi:POP1-domain-containing protein [Trametes versicolor FP-101664 SS1]|uniref:POP1-domain-containing protein n=1 Tax=Trametes versicolor (strain FP-101664) TaxID=717944 RepID=UPI0004621498|nr:POP1-domain-containing protein [Trametes versicolor FP-101664 SS1]EIW59552.1 POP1-domain-containing protein [Trametes versicolor FP-101664 SS1]
MAPKRASDTRQPEDVSGRERKKQKTAAARTIAVQPTAGPSATGENAKTGPSKSVRFDSMKGLPGALDVERFAESRAFEINAMHEAMQNARSASTQRAWQQLPRHLRRRAASHDVRRVPLRLRDKARAEMDPARRKALGRSMPKKSKRNQPNRTGKLLARQKDKTWLETHLWHAKRMHMDNMWGYRLATTPTEKSFRPSHRASVHGSILHDASYQATIEIVGPEDILRAILDSCCDCQGPSPGAKRFLTGARAIETHIYGYNTYPDQLLTPATILWHAEAVTSSASKAQTSGDDGSTSKGKGKEKATATTSSDPEHKIRTVWIRVHPAATAEAHRALRHAASFAIDTVKQTGRTVEVEIADLREQFNVFEIMGPKASQVLKGALKPVDDNREDSKKFWASLSKIQSAGSVPRGMVIGFMVHDPRLSFPPKNVKVDLESSTTLSPSSTVFPSTALAQSQIWDEKTRIALRTPKYKKRDIDQRRSNNLVPGTPLKSERKDDRIPVLLIQRSVENNAFAQSATASNPRSSTTNALHGWTLIVPQGWGMPFFSSLTYTGTRVGGQRERQTQAFEAGSAYFPRDFPATDAYEEYAEGRAEEDRETWERKPPAKRPNYEKLGTRSPWKPDWNVVLGLEKPDAASGEDLLNTQREVEMTDTDPAASVPAPVHITAAAVVEQKVHAWLLRGSDVATIIADVSAMLSPAAGLLMHVNQVRAKRKLDPLHTSVRAEDLLQAALVQVAIFPSGRGCPDDLAIIYCVEDEEARRWISAEASKKNGLALLGDGPDETELAQATPSPEGIIGYVTTGNFSLSLGEGHAVGAMPLTEYLGLRKQAERLRNGHKFLVKLRNRNETICRLGYVELLH